MARTHGWEIHGIRDGFEGLLHPENYPDVGVIKLTRPLVRDIAHLGGTSLGTSNHGNPFKQRRLQPDGSFTEVDRNDEVLRRFRERRLDALIVIREPPGSARQSRSWLTHVPIELLAGHRKSIDPAGPVWGGTLAATRQPERL